MTNPTHPIDVFLAVFNGNSLLLALRQNTGFADGMWNLPSGKLEMGENALSGIIREAHEEIGIVFPEEDITFFTVVHHRNPLGDARMGLFFSVAYNFAKHGSVLNAEPHKCTKIEWFPVNALPNNTYSYTVDGLTAYRNNEQFRLSGWQVSYDEHSSVKL